MQEHLSESGKLIVSESIYIKDPDGNGLELYCDKLVEQWPKDEDGNLIMVTKPLDVPDLLSELDRM